MYSTPPFRWEPTEWREHGTLPTGETIGFQTWQDCYGRTWQTMTITPPTTRERE
jgi:hypothetical protein